MTNLSVLVESSPTENLLSILIYARFVNSIFSEPFFLQHLMMQETAIITANAPSAIMRIRTKFDSGVSSTTSSYTVTKSITSGSSTITSSTSLVMTTVVTSPVTGSVYVNS